MTCPLCTKAGPLRNSHVIPEFLYSSAYDEKHRIGVTKAGARGMRLIQKGIREHLLCDGCEQMLNTRYEQPMSNAWSGLVPGEVPGDSHLLETVDYHTFKLFDLSILWRASIAQGPEWSSVSLGPRHVERIRLAILHRSAPAPLSYPVLGTVFVGPDSRRPCFGWVGPPSQNRFGSARVYSSLYGGCAWHVVVASHAVVHQANPFVLSERGQLAMPAYDIMQLTRIDIGQQIRFRWKPT
jgi:hypothetical protein